MALADWSRAEEADTGRAKRLAGSYAVAAGLVAAVLVIGVVFGGQIKKQVLDEEVNVKFVPPEPVKAAPPPPPPAPAPKVATATQRPKLGSVTEAPPTELPKGPPVSGDPNKPKEEGPDGEGDPNGCVGCTGKGGPAVAPKPVETAPPAPPAPLLPPMQVAEVSTPATITSKTMPAYPEEARKQGIEAVVIVKLIIDEAGRLEDVKIAKGHPLFDEVVLAAIRSWTFEPATLEGKPVRMAKLVKIPFRLKAT